MRRALVAVVLLLACRKREAPASIDSRYLNDPAFRRARLASSLTSKENDYARIRLARYAAWSNLPEEPSPIVASAAARRGDRAALRALGREAFFRFPVESAPRWARDGDHGLQHLVKDGDGLALTCATCHARGDVPGPANDALDLGRALVDAHPGAGDDARARALAWGKGRVDVSSNDGREPARIPDLRPVRFLGYLQWSGAVRRRDVVDLALRIETLMITSRNHASRPPRVIALALATYVDSLADALPKVPETSPGAVVFAKHCGGCHEGIGLVGGLVAASEVGTDPLLARSPDRGTGAYRVPSLRGVGTRGALLHDGSVASLEALLDPTRTGGHVYGKALSPEERAALLSFLRAL